MEFEQKREGDNQAFVTAQNELQQMVMNIPEQFRTPQMLEQARAQLETVRTAQAQQLLQRVPSWADTASFEADQAVMLPHIAEYGFTEQEYGQIYDARLIAYVRANALREKRLKDALSVAMSKRQRKPSKQNTSGVGKQSKPSERGKREERGAAVAQLLSGK